VCLPRALSVSLKQWRFLLHTRSDFVLISMYIHVRRREATIAPLSERMSVLDDPAATFFEASTLSPLA